MIIGGTAIRVTSGAGTPFEPFAFAAAASDD
jgi:hypothetical protein